jgi:hypothetical protein
MEGLDLAIRSCSRVLLACMIEGMCGVGFDVPDDVYHVSFFLRLASTCTAGLLLSVWRSDRRREY